MPNFSENKVDRAYESFMKQIPGFQRDPPEAEVIHQDMKKHQKKEGRKDDLPKR